MKKIVSLILVIVMTLSACFIFTSCGKDNGGSSGGNSGGSSGGSSEDPYYIATAKFYYSEDKGSTYRSQRKEYAVGETVYMKLIAKVTSNNSTPETIKMKLTIPNITAVDAKYFDGQPITPTYDSIQNVTTYEFTIAASSNAQDWEFVFLFIPNADAEVTMNLEFDYKVDSIYDKQNTVKFVKATDEE